MNRTKIPWADFTWGIVEGCSAISEGCQNCYARAMARRFGRRWGHPVWRSSREHEPSARKKPAVIFVASCSDLFHEDDGHWDGETRRLSLAAIWDEMGRNQQHTFLILTKRPLIMRAWVQTRLVLPNVWLGVSAENQARWDQRVPVLCSIPAAGHFVSVEPMLGPVSIQVAPTAHEPEWVICGQENGPGARAFDPLWARALELECRARGIPFFDKFPGSPARQWPAGVVPARGAHD